MLEHTKDYVYDSSPDHDIHRVAMNSKDDKDIKIMTAENEGLRASNAKAASALKLCIAELQLWMRTHGDDLDTQETIYVAQAALRKLAIFAN